MLVSVIIPYYQRDSGILRRALSSILAQALPGGVAVEVIVVDDASPVPVAGEVEGLVFQPPFSLKILSQPNGGVAAARNTALRAVSADTTYIAFLDSDDSWYGGHVAKAVAALEQGFDLYFCDNERDGHHASHFSADGGLILPLITAAKGADPIAVSRDVMTTLTLRDFPCQISTAMYRRSVAAELLFDTSVRNAGEDVIFFLTLVARARVCFSPAKMVYCGSGINLYFSNMGWETPGYMQRLIDNMRAHTLIGRTVALNASDREWNDRHIALHKRDIAFHTLRRLAKGGGMPQEVRTMAKRDARAYLWLPYYAVQAVVGKALGLYKPK